MKTLKPRRARRKKQPARRPAPSKPSAPGRRAPRAAPQRRLAAGPARPRQELEALLGQTPAAIAIMRGPRFVFEFVNRLFERVAGRRIPLGRPLREAMPELLSQPGLMEVLERVMRTGDTFVGQGFPVALDRQGSGLLEEAFFNLTYAPLKDAQGRVSGVMVHAVEVSEQVRARKRAEALAEALRLSEERHRRIVETAEEGIWVLDAQGRTSFANQKMARMLGCASPDELHGTTMYDFMDAEVHEAAARQLAQRLQGQAAQLDFKFRRRDGSELWALVSSSPVTDAHGQVAGVLGMLTDITARKHAEERLLFLLEASRTLAERVTERPAQTLARVAQLAARTVASWCHIDMVLPDGRVERVAGVHRRPGSQPLVEALARFAPRPEGQGPLQEALRTGRPVFLPQVDAAQRARIAQGPEHLALIERLAPLSSIVVPIQVRGRTAGLITLSACAPERPFVEADVAMGEELARRAAAALDNEQLFQAARTNAWRARFLADAYRAFEEAESDLAEALQRVVHHVGEAVQDACVLTLVDAKTGTVDIVASHHPDPEALALLRSTLLGAYRNEGGMVMRVVRTGEPVLVPRLAQERLLESVAPQARPYVERYGLYSVLAVPLRVGARTIGTLGVSRSRPEPPYGPEDLELLQELARRAALVIENSRLLHEARAAVRLRDEFLAVASHELKTPLTPLQLKLQSLQRDARGEKPGQVPRLRLLKDLEVAEGQVRRLGGLIHTLLDVSRITQGRLSLQLEEVDLAALVQGVAQDFALQAARSGSALEVEVPPHPLAGRWDRLRLEQVVQNLLSNALKYGAGGPVQVRLEAAPSHARLSVRDQGIGIAPEVLPRLFGRFERGVSERHYGGLGLGLYITRHIVEAMGGQVRVQSAPGQGATFTVELPLEAPPAPRG